MKGDVETPRSEGAADCAESWIIDVPFQHVFVEAKMREIAITAETPREIIEREYGALCRVELCESAADGLRNMRVVDARLLVASCPFCGDGEEQSLESGNWVSIHDWNNEEYEAAAQSEEEYIDDHWMDIRVSNDVVGAEKSLVDSFFRRAIEKWGEASELHLAQERNAYGMDLAEMLDKSDGQLGFDVPGMPLKSIVYGVEGYFGGLYRCPCCGGVFAAIFRSGDGRRRRGRFGLLSWYDEALDVLLDARRQPACEAATHSVEREALPTMSAEVRRSGDVVSLRTNIAGCWHRMEFNTRVGSFRLDGSSYVHCGFRSEAFLHHPLVSSGLFGSRALVERLLSLLEPLPDELELCFGENQSLSNLLVVIAANRFVGYPVSFYAEDVASVNVMDFYPLGSLLPRDYADVAQLYVRCGLPDKKSLKRVLFKNPVLLCALLEEPDLPFGNIDILRRFLELSRAKDLMRLVNSAPRSCAGWRWLASKKGDSAVLDFLVRQPREAIVRMSDDLDLLLDFLKRMDPESVECMRMSDVRSVLSCQRWRTEHPGIDLDKPYAYDDFGKSLELRLDAFEFVLPRSPRDLVMASIELSNCLDTYAHRDPLVSDSAVVLVREEGKLVGCVEADRKRHVLAAMAKCNKPVEKHPGLAEALGRWMDQNALRQDNAFDDF